MGQVEAILIAGPTASGKSGLASRLAAACGGTVVNADSMQVYRDLRILTARPDPGQEAAVPHALYGHVDGSVNFSVGRWLAEADAAIAAARAGGRLPVVAGGTGLYFKALTEGLSDLPPVPDAVRSSVRDAAEGRPAEALHAELAGRDPATAARLRPSDRQRVLRALEFHAATGTSLSSAQGSRRPGPLAASRTLRVFIAPPDRAAHRAAIDARFDAMLEAGALDEAARLAERRLDPSLPVMRAHGVPALLAHLRGECGLAEAASRGRADTRAYAKRQWTWFRHQMPGFRALEPERADDEIAEMLRAPS